MSVMSLSRYLAVCKIVLWNQMARTSVVLKWELEREGKLRERP